MSSIPDPRLAMIGAAIDELAEASRAASGEPGTSSTPGTSAPGTSGTPGSADARDETGTMAERVARIWAMVADLDPGLAQRLPGYTDQALQDQPSLTRD